MKILFQGDSITDCFRNREDGACLGQGYPVIVSSQLGLESPKKFQFFNRGISGNRVIDLYARWRTDCWDLAPDVISILIGVNDVWSELKYQDRMDHLRFQKIYEMLLEETIFRLPKTQIILLEPFVLPGEESNASGLERFQQELALCQKIVAALASQFSIPFIPLQENFSALCKQAEPSYWLYDGVHPTPAGHGLISEKWIATFMADKLNQK